MITASRGREAAAQEVSYKTDTWPDPRQKKIEGLWIQNLTLTVIEVVRSKDGERARKSCSKVKVVAPFLGVQGTEKSKWNLIFGFLRLFFALHRLVSCLIWDENMSLGREIWNPRDKIWGGSLKEFTLVFFKESCLFWILNWSYHYHCFAGCQPSAPAGHFHLHFHCCCYCSLHCYLVLPDFCLCFDSLPSLPSGGL